jgi:hypothetical protein
LVTVGNYVIGTSGFNVTCAAHSQLSGQQNLEPLEILSTRRHRGRLLVFHSGKEAFPDHVIDTQKSNYSREASPSMAIPSPVTGRRGVLGLLPQ